MGTLSKLSDLRAIRQNVPAQDLDAYARRDARAFEAFKIVQGAIGRELSSRRNREELAGFFGTGPVQMSVVHGVGLNLFLSAGVFDAASDARSPVSMTGTVFSGDVDNGTVFSARLALIDNSLHHADRQTKSLQLQFDVAPGPATRFASDFRKALVDGCARLLEARAARIATLAASEASRIAGQSGEERLRVLTKHSTWLSNELKPLRALPSYTPAFCTAPSLFRVEDEGEDRFRLKLNSVNGGMFRATLTAPGDGTQEAMIQIAAYANDLARQWEMPTTVEPPFRSRDPKLVTAHLTARLMDFIATETTVFKAAKAARDIDKQQGAPGFAR